MTAECRVSNHFYDDYIAELWINTVISVLLFTSFAEIIRNYEYDLASFWKRKAAIHFEMEFKLSTKMKSKL